MGLATWPLMGKTPNLEIYEQGHCGYLFNVAKNRLIYKQVKRPFVCLTLIYKRTGASLVCLKALKHTGEAEGLSTSDWRSQRPKGEELRSTETVRSKNRPAVFIKRRVSIATTRPW